MSAIIKREVVVDSSITSGNHVVFSDKSDDEEEEDDELSDDDEDEDEDEDDVTQVYEGTPEDRSDAEGAVDDEEDDDDEDDDEQEGLSLEERLKLTRQNAKQAKKSLRRLVACLEDYNDAAQQTRQEHELKMLALLEERQEEREALQAEIDERQQLIDSMLAANNNQRLQEMQTLQVVLAETRTLGEQNAAMQRELEDARREKPGGLDKRGSSSLIVQPAIAVVPGLPNLSGEQMSKILGMLQQVRTFCGAEGSSPFPIPSPEELILKEKQALQDERRMLEDLLTAEKNAKEEALDAMAKSDNGLVFLKQIEQERLRLAEERKNFETNKEVIDNWNRKLKELMLQHQETVRALQQERNVLTQVNDKIKDLEKQLAPLQRKAKVMQIPDAERASDAISASGSLPTSPRTPSSSTSPNLRSLGDSVSVIELGPTRTRQLGGLGSLRGGVSAASSLSVLRDSTLLRTTSLAGPRISRMVSEANFFRASLTESVEESRARSNAKSNRYLLLSNPLLPAAVNSILVAGKFVWIGCSDGNIRIYDKDTARVVTDLQQDDASGINCTEFVQSMKEVWSGHRDGSMKIWNSQTFGFVRKFAAHTGSLTAMTRVGSSVWSVGTDMTIRLWDTKTKRMIKKKTTDTYMLCICYDGADAVWIGTESDIVRWNVKTLKKINTLSKHTKLIYHLTVVYDFTTNGVNGGSTGGAATMTTSANNVIAGKSVWSCSSDNTICIWDLTAGKLMDQVIVPTRVLQMVDFGNDVWCCTTIKSIFRIDKKTLKVAQVYDDAHTDIVSTLAVVPDDCGARVWSGSWDKTLSIWNNENHSVRALTTKQKSALITNWRQLLQGMSGTILSENNEAVEEVANALSVINKLITAIDKSSQVTPA